VSLYRTWRPKSFSELVGQDAVVRTLTSAIEAGKIAHAYLFSGPRGSGKTSAAKIMARCIDCIHGPTATPDNTCENCRAMLDGTALDVLEIDAASNRGIDEIRALRDAVKFAPASMRMKVYIIDEAHMLTKEGANAFLKTLEEPPPHAVFILATTEPEKLPVTILSRCQRYAFRRITIPIMIARMREIATEETIPIDDAALAAIAYRADGGLRDALTMLEQAAAFAALNETITTATIDIAFGASGRNYARTILDAALMRNPSAMLRAIEEASDAGTDMQVLLRTLTAEFRNLLIARIDPELLERDLAPEDAATATERAKNISQATIIRALRLLADASSLAKTSSNARLELESSLLRFILAQEDPTLDALSTRVAALESGTPSSKASEEVSVREPLPTKSRPPNGATDGGSEAAAKQARSPEGGAPSASSEEVPSLKLPDSAAPTKPTDPPTLNKLRAAWQNIRAKIESERPPLSAPLNRAVVDSIEGKAVILKLPDTWSADILRDNTKLIETAIHDMLGATLKVIPKVDTTKPTAPIKTPKKNQPTPEDADALFQYANERIRQQ